MSNNPTEHYDNDLDEFLEAVATAFCPECGSAVYQNSRGRHKKFCSDACRYAWKNKHPKPENWNMLSFICPVCGREFKARGRRKMNRVYCSRACANRGRTMNDAERAQQESMMESEIAENDPVNHPSHYTDGHRIEVIEFLEDWMLPFHLSNSIKYICRSGRKDPTKTIEDLEKSAWYLNRYIELLKKQEGNAE